MPSRIQRRRTAGWATPLCSCGCGQKVIYVGRPSKWGNPIHPSNTIGCQHANDAAAMYQDLIAHGHTVPYPHPGQTAELDRHREFVLSTVTELRGHDLMCWCPLESPCHADALLELANRDNR